mgnify:CR=1 FL=1
MAAQGKCAGLRNRSAGRCFGRAGEYRVMKSVTRADRQRDRAVRLHREATNCLSIAVTEPEVSHAAALIDEAARLMRRSGELLAA